MPIPDIYEFIRFDSLRFFHVVINKKKAYSVLIIEKKNTYGEVALDPLAESFPPGPLFPSAVCLSPGGDPLPLEAPEEAAPEGAANVGCPGTNT